MASVCCNSNVVSISCGNRTVVVRLRDGECHSFDHSDINEKEKLTEANHDSKCSSKGHCESDDIGLGLVCSDISFNGKLLAFCTLAKNLCIVDISGIKPSVVKMYNLVRGASKVKFTPVCNHVVVADKSGDVYRFMPESNDNQGQLILGHLSLLLDVLLSPDEQFIITCDRDEKIRISGYPNGYNIVAYCLGHTEFVSSLHLLPHDLKCLISTSGDGSIRFWDYMKGVEITICKISQFLDLKGSSQHADSSDSIPAITCSATSKIDDSASLVCVAIDNLCSYLVFKSTSEKDVINCNFLQNISLENSHPWGISLSSNNLWLVFSSCNDILQIESRVFNMEKQRFENNSSSSLKTVVEVISDQNLLVDQKKNIVNLLFKRKFENVKEYLHRKELRLLSMEPLNKKVKA